MGSLFDDVMMGARAADLFFKGAKKVGKLAKDGMQMLNESEKFQGLKADLQDKLTNSETLQNIRNEVQQRVGQTGEPQRTARKCFCPQCGATLDTNARFCSSCGAPQEQPSQPEDTRAADELTLPEEPEIYEASPTILENGKENVEVLFEM